MPSSNYMKAGRKNSSECGRTSMPLNKVYKENLIKFIEDIKKVKILSNPKIFLGNN